MHVKKRQNKIAFLWLYLISVFQLNLDCTVKKFEIYKKHLKEMNYKYMPFLSGVDQG